MAQLTDGAFRHFLCLKVIRAKIFYLSFEGLLFIDVLLYIFDVFIEWNLCHLMEAYLWCNKPVKLAGICYKIEIYQIQQSTKQMQRWDANKEI